MVVSDFVLILGIVFFFIFLVIYRKNKFIGNLLFIILGAAIFLSSETNSEIFGSIMIAGGIISLLYDMFA